MPSARKDFEKLFFPKVIKGFGPFIKFNILSLLKQINEASFKYSRHILFNKCQISCFGRNSISSLLRWTGIARVANLLSINDSVLVLTDWLFYWYLFIIEEEIAFFAHAIDKMLSISVWAISILALLCHENWIMLVCFFF